MTRLDLLRFVMVTLLLGCASRSVPTVTASSALSPRAVEAPSVVVTAAVDEEPPLPGESTERWPGLSADAAIETDAGSASGGHHHHAH